MKIRSFDVGLESISRWEFEHEIHLPRDGALSPTFLPIYRPLEDILRRPSLDERLPDLLRPDMLDADLLQPAAMTMARMDAASSFGRAARRQHGRRREILEAASSLLEEDIDLDEDVGRALATLLRG
jgi:hypothetical protein